MEKFSFRGWGEGSCSDVTGLLIPAFLTTGYADLGLVGVSAQLHLTDYTLLTLGSDGFTRQTQEVGNKLSNFTEWLEGTNHQSLNFSDAIRGKPEAGVPLGNP